MDHVNKNQRLETSHQHENDWSGFIRENNLRSVEEIPENYRRIFSNFTHFNKIQSKVFDEVYYTDNAIVISSPTGSGKTVLFELAIIRFLINLELINKPNAYKMVYISPLKALCDERLLDWHNKFNPLGVNCVSVTGDNENYDLYNLKNFSLIITTPEKWDSLTRKWRNNKILMQSIKLFMIDEVHLLNEDIRGSTLEAVLNRMKIMQETLKYDQLQSDLGLFRSTRFMAVSATIPNVEDVAEWLGNPLVPAKCFKFGEELRPVPLKKLVLGFSQQTNNFKFDLAMNYRLQSIILQHSMGKPTLIFCNTRKSVEMTAKHLFQNITVHLTTQQKSLIQESLSPVINNNLREFLLNGIGCHHAGLPLETRRVIENLFRTGNLGILVTTSTLALGVNLPAHLVIIKTTKYYSGGEYKDYSESMILQMIGRAGRPQFDQFGTAVILTTIADKKKYETLVEGHQAIESNLHKHLIEHLNAEVVLKTITDLSVAMQWITSTFLYVRAPKNPRHYGLPLGLNSDQIDRRLLDMCQIEINKLANTGLLTIDQSNIILSPTLSGSLMTKYYIAFETMKLFTKMTGKEALQQVLGIISKCKEFSDIHLRTDEKKALNMFNKNKEETIRFPLNGRITTSDMKVNCIIQAVFGCLPISDYSLNNESQKIMRIGERLAKCLAEHLETKENGFSALLSALTLAKCFHTQLWENSKYVSRQLPGIGSVLSCQLVNAGKTSFQAILDSNPRDLERIMNRKPPFGNTIQDKVKFLPVYELSLTKQENNDEISITVTVTLKNANDVRINSTVNLNSFMNLLVGEQNENTIYLYEKYVHTNFLNEPCIQKKIVINVSDDVEIINAHLISEDWVGIDRKQSIILKKKKEEGDFVCTRKPPNKLTKKSEVSQKKGTEKSKVQTLMDKFFKNNKINNATQTKKKITSNVCNQSSEASTISETSVQKEILPFQTKKKLSNNFDDGLVTPDNTVHNNQEKVLSKTTKDSNEIEICSSTTQHTSKNYNISPGSLRRSMEKYVRDNLNNFDDGKITSDNTVHNNQEKVLSKTTKNSDEIEICSSTTQDSSKNDNISPGSLRRSMEKYVRDNLDQYDEILEKYGESRPHENKKENFKINTSDSSNGNDQNLNNFLTKIDSSNKLPPKPSLVKKLSNIMLEEKKAPNENTTTNISKDTVSNNYLEHGSSTYSTPFYSTTQNTLSSSTPSSIPPQNMSFFSTTISPKIATSRKYPLLKKRNTQKIVNPTRKVQGFRITNNDFENSMIKKGPLSQEYFPRKVAKFLNQPKDKLNHDLNRSTKNEERPILLTNENCYVAEIMAEDYKTNNHSENLKTDAKSISWKSPLVSSPQQKYSPNVSREYDISKLPLCKTTSETASFDNVEESFLREDVRDFLSTSLLETIENIAKQHSNIKQDWKEPSSSQQDLPSENLQKESRQFKLSVGELQHPEKKIKISECPTTVQKFNEEQLEASTGMSPSSMTNNPEDLTFLSEQTSLRGSENNCSFTETFLENRSKYDDHQQVLEHDRYYSRQHPGDYQEDNFQLRRQSISQYNNPRMAETHSFPNYEFRSQQDRSKHFYQEFPRTYTQHNYPPREVNFIDQPCHRPPPSTSCCCQHNQCRNDFPYDRAARKMDYYYDRKPEKPDILKTNVQPITQRCPHDQENFGGSYNKENEFLLENNRNSREDFVPHRFFHNNNNEAELIEREKMYRYQRREPCETPRRNEFEGVHKAFEPEKRYNIDHHQAYERENFIRNPFSQNVDQMMRPHSQSSGFYHNPSFITENDYQRRYPSQTSRDPCSGDITRHNFSLLNSNQNSALQIRYSPVSSQHQDSHHSHRFP